MTSCSQWNEDTSTHRISTYIPDWLFVRFSMQALDAALRSIY
jgi:hypothetical protein